MWFYDYDVCGALSLLALDKALPIAFCASLLSFIPTRNLSMPQTPTHALLRINKTMTPTNDTPCRYHNIFQLIKELDLPSWPLTPFTTSGFWGRQGLITEAPVFSAQPRLPALVGQCVYTDPLMKRLPLTDRLTILPWLYSVLDLLSDPAAYERLVVVV